MLNWITNNKTNYDRVTGKFSFYLDVYSQQTTSASNLYAAAYADQKKIITVPCRYRWVRKRNGLTQEISVGGDAGLYRCSCADIGA